MPTMSDDLESPKTIQYSEEEKSTRRSLNVFIDEVEHELNNAEKVYSKCLLNLFEKIKTEKPKTIFFLDRSARPVYWMLSGMIEELQHSDSQLRMPEVRFISFYRDHEYGDSAIDESNEKYEFDRESPVMVVDESSESFVGERNVDYASNLIEQKIGAKNVIKHVFMERIVVGRIPRFCSGSDTEKQLLYGIEDSDEESMISNPSTSHRWPDERKRYRAIFKNFGKQSAMKLDR